MAWTRFYDLHGGGGQKTDFAEVWIEAEYDEAVRIFKEKLDYDPTSSSCDCCGPDFSIYEENEENREDVPSQDENTRVITLEEITCPEDSFNV